MKPEIDELIHQPVRTKMMAYLGSFGEASYNQVKTSLEITDGHMSTHMKKLVQADYVEVKKVFNNQKPMTTYKLSSLGKRKLTKYLKTLKDLIEG